MKKTRSQNGFTLVEMVISLMIFSIVAVVALGALVKIVSTNRKAQTLQASITNLNFAMETISREMRVGSKYHCGYSSNGTVNPFTSAQECPSDANVIAFQSNKIESVADPCRLTYAYFFEGNSPGPYVLKKAQQIYCDDVLGTDVPYVEILDPNVSITNFKIRVDSDNVDYPLVYLYISGYAGVNLKEKERSYFELQTAISSRSPY